MTANTPMNLPGVNTKESNGLLSLHLGSPWKMGVMNISAPNVLVYEYTQQMTAWLLFVDPSTLKNRHAMQFGLGAASLTKYCRNVLGIKTTAVELNPEVVKACRQWFHLPADDAKLSVIVGDAIEASKKQRWHGSVDALQVDLYDQNSAMPVIDTVGFYADCRKMLTRDGCLTVNLFGNESNYAMTAENIAQAFGREAVWSFSRLRTGNRVILAQRTVHCPSSPDLYQRAQYIEKHFGLPAQAWLTDLIKLTESSEIRYLTGLAKPTPDTAPENSLARPTPSKTLRVVAGGDVMLGRQMPGWVGLRGVADPLRELSALFAGADLALVNLESCVSTEGDFVDKGGRQPYYYHNLPEMLDVLTSAGVTCVATANNHAMDFGAEALAQQIRILETCSFLHFGAGLNQLDAACPKYLRMNGMTVALLGVETETPCMAATAESPGIHHAGIKNLVQAMSGPIAIARAHADIVIVSPHWGPNWQDAPTAEIQTAARLLIDSGADAILGHSAHVLQGVEFHAGRPIVYDMGTLLFDRVSQSTMKDSALFELAWDAQRRCTLLIRPVKLSTARARLAVGDDFERICALMTRLSSAINPLTQILRTDFGLQISGQTMPSLGRQIALLTPAVAGATGAAPQVPDPLRSLKSMLVFANLPDFAGAWSTPVQVNPNLTILGARYANPVRAGRGFVCEVYFRSMASSPGTRVEACIAGLTSDGIEAFAYIHPVAEGIHPPARWRLDEVICDRIVVRPVKTVPDGVYQLCWSLVDLEGGLAMPIEGEPDRMFRGQVLLGDFVVNETAPNGVGGISTELRLPRLEQPQPTVYYQTAQTPAAASNSRPPKLATPENPLLLDNKTIARITSGTWSNVPNDAFFTGMSCMREYLAEGTSGDLFFAARLDQRHAVLDSEVPEAVRTAILAGARAVVVPNTALGLPSDLPLLKISPKVNSLELLGSYVRDQLFTGKRVLVSGTEGKTGFKNMLHHVLSPQISTHACTNSSNLGFSTMVSLASIRQKDRIAIIEAAGTHPGRLAERSGLVKPHLFVLTEVGNEHINFHGSQQAVIESKADIVIGLVEGGFGLLNADSRNYAAVRQAVLARKRVPLMLFGSGIHCNGRLLDRQYEHNAWSVKADIEGKIIDYRLPLLGEHAPLASVSVLLAAYYLGADVAQAAADLHDFRPYESQGVLRRLAHRGGEIACYDNASRASVLSYQSTLSMVARLAPEGPDGKKVAVIGQMIFLGDESETWHAQLAQWVDAAGFDSIILVGKYAEITFAHLRRPGVVIHRFSDYDRRTASKEEQQALIDAIEAACKPGDLLFIKGELDELGEYLRTKEVAADTPQLACVASKPSTVAPTSDMSVLTDLRGFQLSDLPLYRNAIDQTHRTTWQHYFPFIYLHGQSKKTRFLVAEDAGSFCIYRLLEQGGEKALNLFLLPMPMQFAVLERCIERVKAHNRAERASLFRVDAQEVEMFRGRSNTRIVACPQEYIYAPSNYVDLSGNRKRNLRRAIQSVQQLDNLEVLDYQVSHAAACQQVLEQWATLQREKYGGVQYGGFTQGCLEQYDQFSRRDLFGKVIKINGKICSFGFAGEIRQGMGNLFITYSDLRVDGLNKFLYYCLLREMAGLEFANASHAGDTSGLAFAKRALGPAFLFQPYQVYAG